MKQNEYLRAYNMSLEKKWNSKDAAKLDEPLRKEIFDTNNTRKTSGGLTNFFYETRNEKKSINVIVRFSQECCPNNRRLSKKIINKKSQKRCIKIDESFCFSAKLNKREINELIKYEEVKNVYLDREVSAFLNKACPTVNANYAWQEKKSGKNVTVAVVDTGIFPHADLTMPTNRIIGFKDFVKNSTKPYDDNGHGTHVAGDIASNGYSSKGQYKGPAYESKLVGVKVLDSKGSGRISDVIAGVKWCIDNKAKYNIKIINLSLGSKAGGSYSKDLLCEVVEKAWNAGIIVCAAAGNEGPGSGTIGSPGIDPKIITVGALDDRNTESKNDDAISTFSSRGPTIDGLQKPDILCPGTKIISLKAPVSIYERFISAFRATNNEYSSKSGTSMATPICSGVIALLLEQNPKLTPDEVKKILKETSTDMGYSRNDQGYGCVNVQKALLKCKGN